MNEYAKGYNDATNKFLWTIETILESMYFETHKEGETQDDVLKHRDWFDHSDDEELCHNIGYINALIDLKKQFLNQAPM